MKLPRVSDFTCWACGESVLRSNIDYDWGNTPADKSMFWCDPECRKVYYDEMDRRKKKSDTENAEVTAVGEKKNLPVETVIKKAGRPSARRSSSRKRQRKNKNKDKNKSNTKMTKRVRQMAPAAIEPKKMHRQNKCSHCHRLGHNIRRCKELVGTS